MINEMENKPSLDSVSDLEFDKNKLEMMRYRANGLSYGLGFLGILCSVLAAFIGLNSFNPNSVLVIIKILMNVVILLFGFLCCEKAKSYSKNASITLVGIGVVCGLRIFWVPLQLLVNYNKFITATKALDADPTDSAASAKITAAKKYLGRTITGEKSIRWLPANGNFRATFEIIFLVAAAVAFIIAGVIGYIRSVKLARYMASINEKR